MTDAHWKDYFEKMVAIRLIDKHTNYASAYTLQLINKTAGLDLRPK
jgi:NitT/TauT family transport system substrate-binding protein